MNVRSLLLVSTAHLAEPVHALVDHRNRALPDLFGRLRPLQVAVGRRDASPTRGKYHLRLKRTIGVDKFPDRQTDRQTERAGESVEPSQRREARPGACFFRSAGYICTQRQPRPHQSITDGKLCDKFSPRYMRCRTWRATAVLLCQGATGFDDAPAIRDGSKARVGRPGGPRKKRARGKGRAATNGHTVSAVVQPPSSYPLLLMRGFPASLHVPARTETFRVAPLLHVNISFPLFPSQSLLSVTVSRARGPQERVCLAAPTKSSNRMREDPRAHRRCVWAELPTDCSC